jgi:hypothetical protein
MITEALKHVQENPRTCLKLKCVMIPDARRAIEEDANRMLEIGPIMSRSVDLSL